MDAAPTYDFWWRFAAILAAEVAVVAAGAWGLEKISSSGAWRRAVWHVCLVGLAVLVAVETSGLNRIVAARLTASPEVSEATFPSSETFSLAVLERSDALEDPIVFVATPEPTAVVNLRASWWPAMFWLAGFGSVFLWAVFVSALFTVVSRRRCVSADKAVAERARQIAARLGVRGHFRVVEMGSIRAPVSFGILSRTIGLPAGIGETFTASQQEVMLAHELAHVAGRDATWHLFADFVAALLWWHPVAWWVRRRVHVATEAAADEASLAVKNGPIVLAETLVALGGSLLPQHRGALGIKALRSDLACRVQKLMALKDGGWRGFSFRKRWLLKLCGPILLVAGTIVCFAWTGSSRGTPRDEWQNSLAARAYAALSAATVSADIERIPGLLGDAKIFFDAGKLDHAEGLCEEVLKIDSENNEALQLSDAIAKARKASLAQNVAEKSGAKPAEMERILPLETAPSKNRFVAPQTIGSFEQVVSNTLNSPTAEKRGRVRFTEGTGVSNIVYNSKGRKRIRKLLEEIRLPSVMYDNVSLGAVLHRLGNDVRQSDPDKKGIDFLLSAETPLPPIDPATGLPVGRSEPFLALHSRNIRINPPLRNVTLGLALDAICKVAETPLYYSVEEYAVVFLPGERPRSLHTRTYGINRDAVLKHFGRQWTPDPATLIPPPGEAAVQREFMDILRELLADAGVDLAPPKAMFFNDRLGKLMVRATLEDIEVTDQALSKFAAPVRQVLLEVNAAEFRGEAAGIRNVLGIDVTNNTVLNGPQYRLMIRTLEQAAGVDVLGAQRVTTLDGRLALFDLKGPETFDVNSAIYHILPHIESHGSNIHLTILRGRETVTTRVRNGQTAMVILPPVRKLYGDGVSVRVLTRIVFATVTIIDAAGNRLHAEESEMPANPFEGIWILPSTRSP